MTEKLMDNLMTIPEYMTSKIKYISIKEEKCHVSRKRNEIH